MRFGNVLVVSVGVVAVGVAMGIAWRWRRLPLIAPDRALPPPTTSGVAALDALRTLAAFVTAGVIAGVLVVGIGGRLVMRVLAATSGGAAQGRLTDADEVVGEISLGGTIGVVVFVGLFGGLVAAFVCLVLRHWLPTSAGLAGVVLAVLLLGTIGVSDALSPDNQDFGLLTPRWLAVLLVVVTAMLFGVTFAALAARLDAGVRPLSDGAAAIPGHLALIVLILPQLLIGAAGYVAARTLIRGRVRPSLDRNPLRIVGRVVVSTATAAALVLTGSAVVEIL